MTMNYRDIISQFNGQGLAENALLTYDQLQDILDRLMKRATNQSVPNFNHQIAQELWTKCGTNVNGQIVISQYASVLIEAKDILEQRMEHTRAKIRAKNGQRQQLQRQIVNARSSRNQELHVGLRQRLQDLDVQLNQLQEDYRNFDTDFKVITLPFGRSNITNRDTTRINNNSMAFPNQSQLINGRLNNSMRRHSQFFMKRSSTALTVLFILSIALLLIQMLIMLQRHHFIGVLSALSVLGIFALNYFNYSYIKFLLFQLALAVFLDVIWFILSFGEYWSPGAFSTLPKYYPGFLKLILLGVIIATCIKVIQYLQSYRNTQQPGDINCCCCTISVFPEDGPFGKTQRPLSYNH